MKTAFWPNTSAIPGLLVVSTCAALASQSRFDANIKNNSLALNPAQTVGVAAYSDSNRLVVYDIRNDQTLAILDGFVTPRNIIFDRSGKRFFVSDSSLGEILVYDTESRQIVNRFPVGYGAFGTALSPDGHQLWVNNEAASTVTVIDPDTGAAKAVITGFAQPRQGIRFSPDGSHVYVTNFLGDKITLVDAQTFKIQSEITGFKALRAISITRDGRRLFAGNSGTNEIAVVDLSTNQIVQRISVGQDPYGAALSPDEAIVLSGNRLDNSLTAIDAATYEVLGTISGLNDPRQAIVYSDDSKRAYVLNKDLSLTLVDVVHRQVLKRIVPLPHA